MKRLLLIISLSSLLAACASNSDMSSPDVLSNISEGIVVQEKFDLMWQQNRSPLFSTTVEASDYVKDLRIGGYTDWRIPSKAESHNLFFSLDYGKSKAKTLGMKMDGSIWIQEDDGKLIAGEWDAGDSCCIIRKFMETRKGRVRAVRP